MRHAGAIRLDHVLGLKRMFMIPQRHGAREGAYVRFPFEQLLRVIAEESERYRCIVIGEDLGTVPEGFRETMAKWGLWSYRVMLFERDGDGRFRRPKPIRPKRSRPSTRTICRAFAAGCTATICGVKRGHRHRSRRDATRRAPGHSTRCATSLARAHRRIRARRNRGGVARFLGATPSRLVAVALDDILGVREQINIPGTVAAASELAAQAAGSDRGSGRARRSFARVAQAFASGRGRGLQSLRLSATGTFQISRAYSRMARSEENQPMRAVLRMLGRHQPPASATAGRARAARPSRRRNRPPP